MHGSFAAEKSWQPFPVTIFLSHSLSPLFNTQSLLSPILSSPSTDLSLFVLLDISSNKKKISFLHPSEITGWHLCFIPPLIPPFTPCPTNSRRKGVNLDFISFDLIPSPFPCVDISILALIHCSVFPESSMGVFAACSWCGSRHLAWPWCMCAMNHSNIQFPSVDLYLRSLSRSE